MASTTADVTQAADGVFSIHGKGLKLTSKDDIAPYCKVLADMGSDVREIRLGGNTLGVEACQDLAEIIKTKKHLEVNQYKWRLKLCDKAAEWCICWIDCRLCRHIYRSPDYRDSSGSPGAV